MNLLQRYRQYKYDRWRKRILPSLNKVAGQDFETYEQWQEWYIKQKFVDKFWRIHVDRGLHVNADGTPVKGGHYDR